MAIITTSLCHIITESTQANDSNLGPAHAYIDAAGNEGANGILFQTHRAAAESNSSECHVCKNL